MSLAIPNAAAQGRVETPPIVSVILPAKNAAHDLPGAFESVRSQGVDGVEIIVADDGSTDATPDIVRASDCERLRILRIETGGVGPAAARNEAVATARAPLVAFLDADDRWMPGKLVRQLAFHHTHPQAVMSVTDYRHLSNDGRDLGGCFGYWPRWRSLPQTGDDFSILDEAAALIFAENAVGTSTVVARRDALLAAGGFDPALKSASDWEMWLRLALAGPCGYASSIGMLYRMVPGSVTSNRALRISCMEQIVSRYSGAIRGQGAPWACRSAVARIQVAMAEKAAVEGDARRALGHHVAALFRDPNRRVFRATLASARGLLLPPRGRAVA